MILKVKKKQQSLLICILDDYIFWYDWCVPICHILLYAKHRTKQNLGMLGMREPFCLCVCVCVCENVLVVWKGTLSNWCLHFWKRERAFTFKRFQWKYCSIMAKKYLLIWSKLRLGYFMVYCHWCLNNSEQKWTSLLPCFLTAVIGSCQAMCSLPLLCDKIKQWPAHRLRTCLLPFLCWRKKSKLFCYS